jgi:ABC-type Na+ efflux pump permease subunit
VIVNLVFPAFSCTTIITEKTEKAFDLLLTTTVQPWEIVWGKLLSSLAYIYIFLISTLPLLAITLLFGGVEPEYMFWAYFILFVQTLFISIYALYASASHTSVNRAIGSTYALVMLMNIPLGLGLFTLLYEMLFIRSSTPLILYHAYRTDPLFQRNILIGIGGFFLSSYRFRKFIFYYDGEPFESQK